MPALKRVLLILLVFSPAIFTAKLVLTKSVDVGNWDQWENAPLLQKWHDGSLTWHDLYAPQIQHRIVVPRLLVIALTELSGGDFRWENYATFLTVLLGAALLYRLLLKTLGSSAWVHALGFIANVLIFSPMQYQIFFWGSSLWMTIPMPCLLLILNLLAVPASTPATLPPPNPSWWLLPSVLLIALVATHSFAHGILFWPIIAVFFLLQPTLAPTRTRLIFAGITALVGAVTITCYFSNFYNVAHHAYSLKPGDYAMESNLNFASAADRAKFIGFFLAFLGTPFARTPFVDHPLADAQFIGAFVLAALLIVAALMVFTKTGRRIWREALPWLALAAYVVGVALAISKGRSAIGEHRAVTTRYLVISVFLPASSLALWFLYAHSWLQERYQNAPIPVAPRIAAACLLTAFTTMQVPQWRYGIYLTNVWQHARRQAQALVMFLPHLTLPKDSGQRRAMLNVLDKDSADWHCLDAINTLNGLGLLKFRPLASADLKWFKLDEKVLSESKGAKKGEKKAEVSTAKFDNDGTLELTGTARFAVGQPADAVLITQGDKVIGLGEPSPKPILRIYGLDYEFANVDEMPVASMYPWKAVVPEEALPPGPSTLDFWALDVEHMRIAKIASTLIFDPSAKSAQIK